MESFYDLLTYLWYLWKSLCLNLRYIFEEFILKCQYDIERVKKIVKERGSGLSQESFQLN